MQRQLPQALYNLESDTIIRKAAAFVNRSATNSSNISENTENNNSYVGNSYSVYNAKGRFVDVFILTWKRAWQNKNAITVLLQKMLTCFDEIVENAFQDEGKIVPVKLEVKEF